MTLFEKAKALSVVAGSKKKKPDNSIKCEELSNEIKTYVMICNRLKELEREKNELNELILQEARSKFMQKYNEDGVFPGTIKLSADNCEVSLITQDKYRKVNEGVAQYLESKYDIKCESKTSFTFNPDLLQKYEEELSRLIEGSKIIAEEDKAFLISAKTENNVPDGTIKKVPGKHRVPQFLLDVGVVHYLKA